MTSNNVSRRNFGSALASFFSGLGVASLFGRTASASASPAVPAPQAAASGVTKLSYDGKPTDGKSFITPLVIYNGVIYIAGQGAMTVFNTGPKVVTQNFKPGDIGYVKW